MSKLRDWLKPPSTNYSLGVLKTNPYSLIADREFVLDVGAKQRGGDYWEGSQRLRVISMDLPSRAVQAAGQP